jgi:hypothetical protein
MWKEAQSSKLKTQKKLQAPCFDHVDPRDVATPLPLELGTWNFFGALSFELGTWAANHCP